MGRTSKSPPDKGGPSRDSFAGLSHPLSTLSAYQAQTLILAHAVRPEWAAMLAALAFDGDAHG